MTEHERDIALNAVRAARRLMYSPNHPEASDGSPFPPGSSNDKVWVSWFNKEMSALQHGGGASE